MRPIYRLQARQPYTSTLSHPLTGSVRAAGSRTTLQHQPPYLSGRILVTRGGSTGSLRAHTLPHLPRQRRPPWQILVMGMILTT